jgi:hypothetical protein
MRPCLGLSHSAFVALSGLALAVGLATAGTARAEQREFNLGVQPVYGLTYLDDRAPSGGGGYAHFSYGITDALGIQLLGGLTAHPLPENAADTPTDKLLPEGRLLTWQASLGLVYSLDVVRIVPFFEASIGVLGIMQPAPPPAPGQPSTKAPELSINASVGVGLGADYLITRRLAVGLAVRYHALITDLSRFPLYLTVGPRLVIRFPL